MKRVQILLGLVVLLILEGCHWTHEETAYHSFSDQSWDRFEKVMLEVPVAQSNHPVQILLFVRHTKAFPYQSLDVHMVMETPSGEERINEYSVKIKNRKGNFLGTFQGDSCERMITLKKALYINKGGVLKIELENLIPRIKTKGLLGVGVRVVE